MQDKDFDRFIRESLNNQQEPAYNPADWDMMEDRLANFNTPQAQPGSGSAAMTGGSMAKLGFVASAVLFTVLNTVAVLKPDLFENKNQPVLAAKNYQEVAAANSEIAEARKPAENTSVQELLNAREKGDQQQNVEVVSGIISGQQALQNSTTNSTSAQGSENAVVKPNQTPSKAKNKQYAARKNNSLAWNAPFSTVAGLSNAPQSGNGSQLSGAGKPGVSIVSDCNGNVKPELAYLLTGNDTLRTKRLNVTTCQSLELHLAAKDKDGDKVNITSNIAEVLPGAQLTRLENNRARVEWKATAAMARQQPYTITFWLSDNRCVGVAPQSYQLAVSVTPAFMVNLNSATSIEKGQTTMLEVVGAPAGSAFRWFTPDGMQANAKSNRLEVSPMHTTAYQVQVISPTGCVATDSARVEVVETDLFGKAAQSRFIPNVITPNNDGSNDYFETQLPENGPLKLEIFDRWGKQVYYKENYQNNWNANDLPAGIYYYTLSAGLNAKIYKGWVEVVR